MKKNITRYKLHKGNFWLFPLFVLPFFEPNIIGALDVLQPIHILVLVWQCLAFVVASILFVMRKGRVINGLSLIMILFSLNIIISTHNKDGDILHAIFYFLEVISITIFCKYFVEDKEKYNSVMNALYLYFSIVVILNLFSMVISPDPESYENWVFSNKNNHIYYILPYLFFAASRNTKSNSWKKILFPFTISFITVILGKSTTSLFSILLVSTFILFSYSKKKVKKSILKYFFIISIVISFVFIVTHNIVYLDAIVAYYDKETTFGRFEIWEKTMDLLSASPAYGVGLESEDTMLEIFGFTHCHNKYLDITYMSGLVGLFFFLSYIFYACKGLNKYRNKNSLLASVILCAYAVEFMMEGKRGDMGFYLVFFLLPYTTKYYTVASKIIKNNNENEQKTIPGIG